VGAGSSTRDKRVSDVGASLIKNACTKIKPQTPFFVCFHRGGVSRRSRHAGIITRRATENDASVVNNGHLKNDIVRLICMCPSRLALCLPRCLFATACSTRIHTCIPSFLCIRGAFDYLTFFAAFWMFSRTSAAAWAAVCSLSVGTPFGASSLLSSCLLYHVDGAVPFRSPRLQLRSWRRTAGVAAQGWRSSTGYGSRTGAGICAVSRIVERRSALSWGVDVSGYLSSSFFEICVWIKPRKRLTPHLFAAMNKRQAVGGSDDAVAWWQADGRRHCAQAAEQKNIDMGVRRAVYGGRCHRIAQQAKIGTIFISAKTWWAGALNMVWTADL